MTTFTADAEIHAPRSSHDRWWDHFGTEPDTVVVLDGPIGRYPSGMNVHLVLGDLIERLTALESGNHRVATFSIETWIVPIFRANAIVFRPDMSGAVTFDAVFVSVLVYVAADAILYRATSGSFYAMAYLIDQVD